MPDVDDASAIKPPAVSSANSDDSPITEGHGGSDTSSAGSRPEGAAFTGQVPPPAPAIQSTSPGAPITGERAVPRDLDTRLTAPGTPRASLACSREHPQGLTPSPDPNLTVLQQHCKFWDDDDDGVVWPVDTYKGFRRLGFGVLISFWAAALIHLALSWLTLDTWMPHPGFPLLLKNIHRGKHGSDSGTYDTEGRFVPQHFEEMFSKYDRGSKGGLSLGDILHMTQGNWNAGDVAGWAAAKGEWLFTYWIAARDTPTHGRLLLKDDALGAFDGTLFHRVADEVAKRKQHGVHVNMDFPSSDIRGKAEKKTK